MNQSGYSQDEYFARLTNELLSARDVLSAFPARPGCAAFIASSYGCIGIFIAVVRSIPAIITSANQPVPCYFADSGTEHLDLAFMLRQAEKQECAVIYVTPSVLLGEELLRFAFEANVRAILAFDADVHIRPTSRVPGTLVAAGEFRAHMKEHIPIAAFMLNFTSEVINTVRKHLGKGIPALFGLPCELFGKLNLCSHKTQNIPLFVRDEVKQHKEKSGVVYCRTKETAEIIYNAIRTCFVPVSLYHSGLERAERKKAAADFALCKTKVLVCTYGYSGGIWNTNTDYVIFADLPYDIPSLCRGLLTLIPRTGEAVLIYSDAKPEENSTVQETELRRLIDRGIATKQLEWYLT